MSRNLVIAVFGSILLHVGTAVSGYLMEKEAPAGPLTPEVPTIGLDMPPPPEPDEPEVVPDASADAPAEVADLAPPMQNDIPSAVIDSPFVQQIQAPPPPGLNRSSSAIVIPTNTRPSVGGGKPLGLVFDLASLDNKPEARVRIKPTYPFDMRRSGLKGEVVIEFIVDASGEVRDPVIIRSSNPGFEEAAIQAVLKWKFKPGKKGGAAVSTRVQQPLNFNLGTE